MVQSQTAGITRYQTVFLKFVEWDNDMLDTCDVMGSFLKGDFLKLHYLVYVDWPFFKHP